MYDKLTRKDIALMEAELEDRRLNQRPKIMEEVKRTREFGDLSENYEYKAAKQAQRRNDSPFCLRSRPLTLCLLRLSSS